MISVCIPSYNHEKYLPTLFKSLLASTYKDLEIIFSDDASQDKSLEVAQSFIPDFQQQGYKYKLTKQFTNLGGLGRENWKFVCSEAKGDYICVLEGDDYIHPERFMKQLKALQEIGRCPRFEMGGIGIDGQITEHTEVSLVMPYPAVAIHSDVITINEEGIPLDGGKWKARGNDWWLKTGNVYDNIKVDNSIMTCSFLCRADVFKKAFDFNWITDKGFKITGDWPGFLRVAKEFPIWYIDEPLAYYRQHGESHSAKNHPQMVHERNLIHKYVKEGIL